MLGRRLAALAAGATLGVAWGCGANGDEPPRDREADGAPAASVFVAPRGTDDDPGTRERPFRTLGRAHAAAAPGEVVELAAGEYPAQRWTARSGAPEEPVVFRPAEGASVRIGGLVLDGVHDVEIRDVETDGWHVRGGSRRVTLRDVRSTSGAFVGSARRVSILGGEIGPADSVDGLMVAPERDGAPSPTDILIDGLYVHDLTRDANPDHHTDCVQFGGGVRVTIRNSRFNRCATQGVFARPFNGGVFDDWVIENNWFGVSQLGYYSLILSKDAGPSARFLVRNNSASQSMRIEAPGARVVGNAGVLKAWECGSGVSYRHNVWSEAACGPTDLKANPGFVDAAGFDLRLAPGAAAIDRADPEDFPATDMFGTPRPKGGRADAGAHERA